MKNQILTGAHLKKTFCLLALITVGFFGLALSAAAVAGSETLDRVLTLTGPKAGSRQLPQDQGSAGLWQRLLKLQTTASALYTAAHPDDEQGGVLAYLSRGQGVRMAMMQLNRGESGANAIGSELFDGLGLIRTEELLVAGSYYGLDDQYFTSMIDYGFSKSLDEALDKWGRENVLRDVVRIIRINRPLVLVSRFYGGDRDGHGNHQTAGVITQEAFEAAGDPNRFPEQISQEGLRAWKPFKMYRSNLYPRGFFDGRDKPPEARWQVRVEAGDYSPWLGQSYQNFALLGLSFQRSQNGGSLRQVTGPADQYFERVHTRIGGPEKETGFFEGINTSISGIYDLLELEPSAEALTALQHTEEQVRMAVAAYNVRNPAAVVPALTQGLKSTREALRLSQDHADAVFLLRIKERQFMDAINTALGLQLSAIGAPAASGEDSSPFSPPATLGVVVPGQRFRVETALLNPANVAVESPRIELAGSAEGWNFQGDGKTAPALQSNQSLGVNFDVTVPANAPFSDRYFSRDSIQDPRYKMNVEAYRALPHSRPALVAVAHYKVDGEEVEYRQPVLTREANRPYGYDWRELKVAPAIAVNIKPEMRIIPLGQQPSKVRIDVDLLNNVDGKVAGELRLKTPSGWTAEPAQQNFQFSQPGERSNFSFSVSVPSLKDEDYKIEAVATADGKQYTTGYQTIRYRDYDTTYIYKPGTVSVRGVNVKISPAVKRVGYVMGVGDEVPSGIEQLGPKVDLLTGQDLASSNLSQYDAIVVGTRAYAVREDLITYNQRLLNYAKEGGNLIILYQTQEFVPNKWAPFPAELPRGAEEVSEEDAKVTVLAPDNPVFNTPNKITSADFDNWVEQRGSKFFSQWDPAYTALIETHDRNQEPQKGGWLTAKYGSGYYTYFAYAIHRQVPSGVSGPYRILANLLSLGKR